MPSAGGNKDAITIGDFTFSAVDRQYQLSAVAIDIVDEAFHFTRFLVTSYAFTGPSLLADVWRARE